MAKPIILIGGGHLRLAAYSGGAKHMNLWVKLLRANGYESYLLTQDGRFEHWLIIHQPAISLEVARSWTRKGRTLKSLPMWLPAAKYFLELSSKIYFYDCELAHTSSKAHLPILENLQSRIRGIGTNNHLNYEWYRSRFRGPVTLIPEWSDEQYWHPKAEIREQNLIGYTKEPGSRAIAERVRSIAESHKVKVKLTRITGLDEEHTRAALRRCDFFLGTNPGKHPIYGEGCPRAGNEAMHAGCIVIAYDVIGNREYLDDGHTGFLVPRGRTDLLAEKLIHLVRNSELKEKIRTASVEFALKRFSSPGRWPLVREFLELE